MDTLNVRQLPGLKENEVTPCKICGKPTTHCGSPLFYRITIERYMYDANAVRRQVGLTLMLGNPGLARVMGPDDDMAKRLQATAPAMVCDTCACESRSLAELEERLAVPDTDPEAVARFDQTVAT